MEENLNCAIQFLQEERHVSAWMENYSQFSISEIRIEEKIYSCHSSCRYDIPLSLPIFPVTHYYTVRSGLLHGTDNVDLVGNPVRATAVLDNGTEVSLDNLYPMWVVNIRNGIGIGSGLVFCTSFPKNFRELPEPDEQMHYHIPPKGGYTKGVRRVS